MGFSAEERETNINWTDADEGIAHVYTCQPWIRRKLRKLAKKYPGFRLVMRDKDDHGKVTGVEWGVPLEFVRSILPGRKRQMSEAQREAASQRMKEMRRAPVD